MKDTRLNPYAGFPGDCDPLEVLPATAGKIGEHLRDLGPAEQMERARNHCAPGRL
jgi:hypothetical protein